MVIMEENVPIVTKKEGGKIYCHLLFYMIKFNILRYQIINEINNKEDLSQMDKNVQKETSLLDKGGKNAKLDQRTKASNI